MWLLVQLLLYLTLVERCDAFASELCKRYCDKELVEGSVMMGTPVRKNVERTLRVTRLSGDSVEMITHYTPGESLLVKLDPPSRQCVLEVEVEVDADDAAFVDGTCANNRRVLCDKLGRNQGSLLQIGDNASGVLTIKSGWAKSFGDGVQLSPSLELHPLPKPQNEEL